MSVTYSTVPISVITDLQDYIVNHGAQYVEACSVEVKLYRANQASFGEEGKSKSLFTIWTSQSPDSVWSFGPNNTGLNTSGAIKQIIDTKLQSLWMLRQTFKGDGHVYRLEDGSIIRLSNILVQGNYKGLLIDADGTGPCQDLLKKMSNAFALEPPSEDIITDPMERARMYQKVYQ